MNGKTQSQLLLEQLLRQPKTWLITGVAGFIGSNLLEALLKLNQKVIGLDNFATGHQYNLDEVQSLVSPEQRASFTFIEGDIRQLEDCQRACKGVDYVLHQAALGSVLRSIADPITTYGDHPALPKVEDNIGKPLSPYAVTKYVNELYADVFAKTYGFNCVGLRYFNVFGKRQDPNGAYAAVIPKWTAAMIQNEPVFINGDGETSRDFCYIENTVQANLLAATTTNPDAKNQVYNVAVGDRTTLNQLFDAIQSALKNNGINYTQTPTYREFREGDVRHSQADVSKAKTLLGYEPSHRISEGIAEAMPWYVKFLTC